MVRSELEKVHLSNGGRSRTAAACSGVEFRNGSQLLTKPPVPYDLCAADPISR